MNNRTPDTEPVNNSRNRQTPPTEPRPAPGKNPRLVVGGLDYFELLMEQEEA